ncbi:putative CDP-diacylglycerol--serine O-phosphatidyltransferase 2 [Nannochloris sp. 'desiccata']|nr:putative CDP-diacylglycerol--serine O-phosphatidyltransferase 2 [Chlorella desiccata (nom. nud.)]
MPPRSKSQSQSKPRAAGPQDYDPTTQFLYVPHTVTFLLAGLVALAYFSHPLNPPQRPENPVDAAQTAYFNAKTGIWALVLVFLGYSVVQGPSTKMVRPHPAFWKLVHGMTVCYLLFWVYMLFQNVDDARLFLRHMYPELGVDLDERSYGGNCALILPNGGGINWPVIKATIFDEFVVAHTLGWWGKALIIRDNVMLWIISISFELMELTFQHWLPNFNECWWDSWLLDVAICNAIGIVTGMWTEYYEFIDSGDTDLFRKVEAAPRVFGVSDCHTDYLENFKWAESLDKQAFRNDILLLAGDVCDELTLLEDTLTLLKSRFACIFYCPGNHCLWIRSIDASKNSYEKLQRILTLCQDLGVHTTPQKIDDKVWIAPLQSWHHKSFDTDPDIPDIPAATRFTIADYAACTWPDENENLLPPGSQRHGSVELAQWFDSLNDGPIWDELLKTRHDCDVISFSHFLPDIALMPEKRFLFYPPLVKASGSIPLAERIEALKPDIHLFGHTHFAWDAEIKGTRYIQAPLAAPLERHRRLRTICFTAFMTEIKIKDGDSSGSGVSSSTWKTVGDPTEAKWLPIELFQFNNPDLCLANNGDIAAVDFAFASFFFECQHRGPNEPIRDAFTAANEATHGIITPNTGSDVDDSSPCEDEPLSLCGSEERGEKNKDGSDLEKERQPRQQRKQLKFGTMPGPLGAHWSDYYASNPRAPEITTLATWVAHLYQKRKERRQKEEKRSSRPAATTKN